jgi:hypothetical protein
VTSWPNCPSFSKDRTFHFRISFCWVIHLMMLFVQRVGYNGLASSMVGWWIVPMTTLQGICIYESVSLRLFAWCSQYNIIMHSWQTTPPFGHDQKKPYAQSEATNSLGNKWHPYAQTIERQNSKRIGVWLPAHVGSLWGLSQVYTTQPFQEEWMQILIPTTKGRGHSFDWFHSLYSPSS